MSDWSHDYIAEQLLELRSELEWTQSRLREVESRLREVENDLSFAKGDIDRLRGEVTSLERATGEQMVTTLRVGAILYGFCGGAFGRDGYGNKRIEAIGADWVVARDDGGYPWFYHGYPNLLAQFLTPESEES